MNDLFKTTLRINRATPDGLRAWTYLKNRDRSRYRSYSEAIIAAVNGFFDREQRLSNDPYLETREKEDAFLQRVLETMERGMQAASISGLAVLLQNASSDVPKTAEQDTSAVDEDLETALDFVNSL